MVTMVTEVTSCLSDLIGQDTGDVIMITMVTEASNLIGRDIGDIIKVTMAPEVSS